MRYNGRGRERTSEPGEPPSPLFKGGHWEWVESEQRGGNTNEREQYGDDVL